jgi:hypothetical protein
MRSRNGLIGVSWGRMTSTLHQLMIVWSVGGEYTTEGRGPKWLRFISHSEQNDIVLEPEALWSAKNRPSFYDLENPKAVLLLWA